MSGPVTFGPALVIGELPVARTCSWCASLVLCTQEAQDQHVRWHREAPVAVPDGPKGEVGSEGTAAGNGGAP